MKSWRKLKPDQAHSWDLGVAHNWTRIQRRLRRAEVIWNRKNFLSSTSLSFFPIFRNSTENGYKLYATWFLGSFGWTSVSYHWTIVFKATVGQSYTTLNTQKIKSLDPFPLYIFRNAWRIARWKEGSSQTNPAKKIVSYKILHEETKFRSLRKLLREG